MNRSTIDRVYAAPVWTLAVVLLAVTYLMYRTGIKLAMAEDQLVNIRPAGAIYQLHGSGNSREVGITCANGADPTGRKVGEEVIISCGE